MRLEFGSQGAPDRDSLLVELLGRGGLAGFGQSVSLVVQLVGAFGRVLRDRGDRSDECDRKPIHSRFPCHPLASAQMDEKLAN